MLVRYINNTKQDEWIPKNKLEKSVIEKYIAELPGKTLKKEAAAVSPTTKPVRRSERIKQKYQ
jgi:hypothetical protein